MAIVYDVERMPDDSIELSGNEKFELSGSLELNFRVHVYDDADPFDPRDIDGTNVIGAVGLPTVNRSVYTTANGKIIPYFICRKKRVRRDASAFGLFHVQTTFKNIVGGDLGGGETDPVDPPDALTDISPQVKVELGEVEKVLYIDKSSSPKAILTPTKNFYSEPAVERIATQMWKISQYESSITYDQMQERKFKVNSLTFQGEVRFKWLIEHVEASEVDVTLSGGVTSAALVTYTVIQSPFEHGWKDDRSLIDTHYISGGKKIAFIDDSVATSTVGFIDSAGARKTAGTVVPDRVQFETFDDIDFEDFLHPSLFV